MDMEIARLLNVSWLRIPDRQVVALRAAMLSADRFRQPPGDADAPLPALDWPADLFADTISSH